MHVQTAKKFQAKQNSPHGINQYHTTFLLLTQLAFIIIWALFMKVMSITVSVPLSVHVSAPPTSLSSYLKTDSTHSDARFHIP